MLKLKRTSNVNSEFVPGDGQPVSVSQEYQIDSYTKKIGDALKIGFESIPLYYLNYALANPLYQTSSKNPDDINVAGHYLMTSTMPQNLVSVAQLEYNHAYLLDVEYIGFDEYYPEPLIQQTATIVSSSGTIKRCRRYKYSDYTNPYTQWLEIPNLDGSNLSKEDIVTVERGTCSLYDVYGSQSFDCNYTKTGNIVTVTGTTPKLDSQNSDITLEGLPFLANTNTKIIVMSMYSAFVSLYSSYMTFYAMEIDDDDSGLTTMYPDYAMSDSTVSSLASHISNCYFEIMYTISE